MTHERWSRPALWLAGLIIFLGCLSLAAAGLVAVRWDRVGKLAFLFLLWNLFLAWIPMVLSLGVAAVHNRGGSRLLLWMFGAAWLLFLPNAPYILTDFIHLGRAGGAPLWFDAALIGTFAGTGLALGLASLLIVHHVVEARAGRVVGWAFAVSSLVLSAVGIYLGRFPRFNSWDVVADPQGLVAVVLHRLGDPFGIRSCCASVSACRSCCSRPTFSLGSSGAACSRVGEGFACHQASEVSRGTPRGTATRTRPEGER